MGAAEIQCPECRKGIEAAERFFGGGESYLPDLKVQGAPLQMPRV